MIDKTVELIKICRRQNKEANLAQIILVASRHDTSRLMHFGIRKSRTCCVAHAVQQAWHCT